MIGRVNGSGNDREPICDVSSLHNEDEIDRERKREKKKKRETEIDIKKELIVQDHDNFIEEEDECVEGQNARGRRRIRGRRPSRGAERAQFRQHCAPEQSLSGERRNAISGLCSVSLLKRSRF